jgi:hypothetical protein
VFTFLFIYLSYCFKTEDPKESAIKFE